MQRSRHHQHTRARLYLLASLDVVAGSLARVWLMTIIIIIIIVIAASSLDEAERTISPLYLNEFSRFPSQQTSQFALTSQARGPQQTNSP